MEESQQIRRDREKKRQAREGLWASEWPTSNSDGHSLDVVGNFIG